MDDVKHRITEMLGDIEEPKYLTYIYQVVKALFLKPKGAKV